MEKYRLYRLFHPVSNRCLDIAADHGCMGEAAILTGLEDMPSAMDTLVGAGPDAIQVGIGQAPLLQARPTRDKPALVLRVDNTNVYGRRAPDEELFSLLADDAVNQAVRLDAACVVVNLLDMPGHPELRRDCLDNIARLQADCAVAGMPLMVEPLALDAVGDGYDSVGDTDRIVGLVRQAVELGADVIKADPTEPITDFGRVVRAAAPVPVLVRGGSRVADEVLFERTRAMLDQGARGLVYGRNIFQHPEPAAMTAALLALLHDDASPQRAADIVAASQRAGN